MLSLYDVCAEKVSDVVGGIAISDGHYRAAIETHAEM